MAASVTETLQELTLRRMAELGLGRSDLVGRLGYRNVAKALRNIDLIRAGGLPAPELKPRIAAALDIPPERVEASWQHTVECDRLAEDAVWRSRFRPHAVAMGEYTVPTQITIVGMMGIWNIRGIELDCSRDESTFAEQALTALEEKTKSGGQIPFFGRPIGVIVNYTPDRAVHYALDGTVKERLEKAYRFYGAVYLK